MCGQVARQHGLPRSPLYEKKLRFLEDGKGVAQVRAQRGIRSLTLSGLCN